MEIRQLEADYLGLDVDWVGNNAAFTCPACSKVFLVSGRLHIEGRSCPKCGKSKGYVSGGAKSGGAARLELEKGSPSSN